MQISRFGTTLIVALSILGLADARAAGTYVKLDYPASSASNELQVAVTYTLWPDKESKDQKLRPMNTRKAWLAPLFGDEAKPAAEFKGNENEAVWLPNAAVAKAWMEYVKTGATSDKTPPSAPYHIKIFSKGEQGTEITWDAEADFESGIQQFIVLRDGQEMGQVP
jgi:hypothetical protein